MYTLEGVSSVANFITAYEESQKNRDSHFLICSVFFVSKGNLLYVYLTSVLGLDDMSLAWPAVVQLLVFIYPGIQ